MLAADRLLTGGQMDQAVALLASSEQDAAEFADVVTEVRNAHRKVIRCQVDGEFLEFLVQQYRLRGLTTPHKIATLVLLEDATNALKRAMTLVTTLAMRSQHAA